MSRKTQNNKRKVDGRKNPLRGTARQLSMLVGQIRLMRAERAGLYAYCEERVDTKFEERLGEVRHQLNELFRRLVSLDNALNHDWRITGVRNAAENTGTGTGA